MLTKLISYFTFILILLSQNYIEGYIFDESSNPIPNTKVFLKGTKFSTLSNDEGYFQFTRLKLNAYTVIIEHIAFKREELNLDVNKNHEIKLKERSYMSSEVSVTALRANNKTPLSFTNVSNEEIKKNNLGQDLPFLLSHTPSYVESSDAGAGVGYTSFKIRGTDISRINVTIDGIPLNEGESHGVWWVDLPDLAASIETIQIQRGVGSSSFGTGAFGAAVNIDTKKIQNDFSATAKLGTGSYNTKKMSINLNSGIINENLHVDLRYSNIQSDGYIDRASSKLRSFYTMFSYLDQNNLIRFNYIHGKEKTYQAWNGVPAEKLENDRTFNPYNYENETDNYTQDHYRLHFYRKLKNNLSANLSFHWTHGEGYYEQFKGKKKLSSYGLDSINITGQWYKELDIIQQRWLDNDFWGFVSSLDYQLGSGKYSLGISANRYLGDHFGDIIRFQKKNNSKQLILNQNTKHRWYNGDGDKREFSAFLKSNYHLSEIFIAYIDFQFRNIKYEITGIDNDLRDIGQKHNYSFFNPKIGLNAQLNSGTDLYASFAVAHREPARADLTDAKNTITPKAERLHDFELGLRYRDESNFITLNGYYMDYKDQLVLSGAINDVGSAIKINVPESYRAGIELSLQSDISKLFAINYSSSFSKNKIKNFTEYVDDWDNWGSQKSFFYKERDISLSPELIQSIGIDYKATENLLISLNTKYVSEQFIDNSSSKERKLDAYSVSNLHLQYKYTINSFLKNIVLDLKVNNIFYEKYESNAWVYSYFSGGERKALFGYFPQAPRNFLLGLTINY